MQSAGLGKKFGRNILCLLCCNSQCIIFKIFIQTYTRVRFGIQLVIGILSGLMYFNTGNEASQSLNIIGNVIYAQLVYAW